MVLAVLHLHRAERADGLVDALGKLLAVVPADPFAVEVVSVPTRGIERWLAQQTAARLGICANVEFPPPRRLLGDAVAVAAGIDPERDPWLPERMVWPLLEVVDACLGEPWLAELTAHLARPERRFGAVRHLADLYDRYALQRPERVLAWARGEQEHWQAELWRRLAAAIGIPGPAERRARACERLRAEPGAVELPERLSLFGLTRLPAGHLEVLRALAVHRDVHLFVLHPSPALWAKVAGSPPVLRRAEDQTVGLARNRLLASWGHDARELGLVLAAAGEAVDHHHPAPPPGETLLARLQADIRADRAPAGDFAGADSSVVVHACHGRARQVEVLRDAILHLLADDPTLEPRDVIVMCPDIEAYAPLIAATFGAADEDLPPGLAPPDLRVRLADRSLRQTNPVLGVVARLLDLAGERLTASQVLDLADREPVRRRFRLDDDDLARLEDWVAASGIRWGLDAEHRAPFKVDLLAGTWRAGLDRLLVGVTMTEDEQRLFARVLPLDDVDSGAIDLAGRFAELLARLRAAVDALSAAQTVAEWARALRAAADALTLTAPREAWQRAELQRLLDDVAGEAGEHATPLSLTELRALLAERLQGRPTRANFRTGHLTICTLVPMRSVPHRVVCLLGLDDGAFPRRSPRDGDDLTLADPHVGDRDVRTEDRQLLLDALLAARERLLITYAGKDERTNLDKPPAVPVGELLDTIERTAPGVDVVVHHPLQPFDPRNFQAIEPWSFDPVTLAGARALSAPRVAPGPFLPAPLAPFDEPLELEDLVRFVSHPVRAFLRRRLQISLADYSEEVQDALAVELDGLQRWGVGQRLLDARLDGVDVATARRAEIARGALPPGQLGAPVVHGLLPTVEAIAASVPPGPASESVDVRVTLAGGRVLTGTVPGVRGTVLTAASFSRVAPKHRLVAWVRLLALTAARPDSGYSAQTIGRGSDGVLVKRLPALDALAAREQLAALLELFDLGMREPPPLYCATSAAYAQAVREGADGTRALRAAWVSDYAFPREDADPEHVLVLGGEDPFAAPARDGERWFADEPTRFGQWARRLWDALLEHER